MNTVVDINHHVYIHFGDGRGRDDGNHQHSEPDPIWKEVVLRLLHTLTGKVDTMSTSVAQLETEIATLKTGMASLHTAASDIQARLDAALAAAGTNIPAADLTDLHSINDDLKAVVTALGPKNTGPLPPIPPVFDPNDTTPNGSLMADGVTIRNSPGADAANPVASFDPSKPATT